MRLARARRTGAGGAQLLAALGGHERVGALVERVGPLGGIGIASRLAEGAVRRRRALGDGTFLVLTPAVGVALVLGHGTSFLLALRRIHRGRCPRACRRGYPRRGRPQTELRNEASRRCP